MASSWKKWVSSFALLLLATQGCMAAAGSVPATDVDGRRILLNAPGQVTVVLYSNAKIQDATREVGHRLDSFQGRPNFRMVVLVDLRRSLASLMEGYVRMRIHRDLDQEAVRVAPFYRANGNAADPRPDLAAVADFDGAVCIRLGWENPRSVMRATVFSQEGRMIANFNPLKNADLLYASVRHALPPWTAPKTVKAAP